MIIKGFFRGLVYAGIIAAGVAVGHFATADREYRVQRDGPDAFLYSRTLDVKHPLRLHDKQVYVGSSAHNLLGYQIIKEYEQANPSVQLQSQQVPNRSVLEKIVHGVEQGSQNITSNIK